MMIQNIGKNLCLTMYQRTKKTIIHKCQLDLNLPLTDKKKYLIHVVQSRISCQQTKKTTTEIDPDRISAKLSSLSSEFNESPPILNSLKQETAQFLCIRIMWCPIVISITGHINIEDLCWALVTTLKTRTLTCAQVPETLPLHQTMAPILFQVQWTLY